MRAIHRSLAHVVLLTLVSLVHGTLLTLAACAPTSVSRETPSSAATSKDLGEIVVTGTKRSRVAQEQANSYLLAMPMSMAMPDAVDRENYGRTDPNPVHRVADDPVSTFSIDVDTGSYSNVRRILNEGRLPPQGAVRVEEMINYFDYAYAAPRDAATPFGVVTEVAPTPWNPKTRLLHIGIQGWRPDSNPAGSNLVFLVDVSGSMEDRDKLPLVKSSLRLLSRQLSSADRISLVVGGLFGRRR